MNRLQGGCNSFFENKWEKYNMNNFKDFCPTFEIVHVPYFLTLKYL